LNESKANESHQTRQSGNWEEVANESHIMRGSVE